MRTRLLAMGSVVLGMAGVGQAQDLFFSWQTDAAGPVGMGDVVTLFLAMSYTPDPGFGLCCTTYDIIGDDIAGGGLLSTGDGRYFRHPGTSPGTIVGDDILGVEQSQDPGGDTSNPIFPFHVFTYTVTDDTPRTVNYTSIHADTEVYADAFGSTVSYNVHVTGTSFEIIPAPSGVALLGLGGLVAVRRRRA